MVALSETERMIVDTVHAFVEREVRPHVRELEHEDRYPESMIEQMKELGIFGLAIPESMGGFRVSMPCYVHVTEELARGVDEPGRRDGRPHRRLQAAGRVRHRGAAGQVPAPDGDGRDRATMALTEPGGGSDLQAMRTVAVRDGDRYVVNGSKTWITNARRSQLIALMCKTDPAATPRHRGVSICSSSTGRG
jgi:alkylation response protein AidB-like acyl-CoA dehydrogenase